MTIQDRTSRKDKIEAELNTLAKCTNGDGFFTIKKSDNIGTYLADIFVAQTVSKWADKRLDDAWRTAADDEVILEDDDLRTKYAGGDEAIPVESRDFSVTLKVGTPRESFDQAAFIEQVAKKFKLDKAKLEAIAENCVKTGKAPLTKRVVEV